MEDAPVNRGGPASSATPTAMNADTIVVERVRVALRGTAGTTLIFGLAAPWLAPSAGLPFLACIVVCFALLGGALESLRRRPTPGRAILLGEIASMIVIALSVAGGITLGQRFTTPMIPIVTAMSTGTFIPWGVGPQRLVAAWAAAGVLLHLAWLGPTANGYPPLVSLLGIALSIPMARLVARDRESILALSEARREAEERFRDLAANTPEMFWWMDAGGERLRFVSAAFSNIWSRPIPEALDSPSLLWETVHPADRDRMRDAIRGLRERGFDEEYRILRPDGSIRTVHTRAYRVEGGADGPPRITGVTEDVTDRRATERALRESENRYAGLIEHAPDAVLTFDGRGRLSSANPAAARLVGRTRDELTDLDAFRFLRMVVPSSRAVVFDVIDELEKRGAAQPAQFEILRRDGEPILVESNQRLLATPTGGVEVQVILRDITERRRAEEAAHIRALNVHLEATRETERRSLATRLHDELAQPLAALRLGMSGTASPPVTAANEESSARSDLSSLVESMIAATRSMIADLHPSVFDDFGLAPAVRWQARWFEQKHGLPCETRVDQEEIRCAEERAVVMFRTLQETLGAIAGDSRVRHVRVTLFESNGEVVLDVGVTGARPFDFEDPAKSVFPWEVERLDLRARRFGGSVVFSVTGEEHVKVHARLRSDEVDSPSPGPRT